MGGVKGVVGFIARQTQPKTQEQMRCCSQAQQGQDWRRQVMKSQLHDP
jgi:hypothetical protein